MTKHNLSCPLLSLSRQLLESGLLDLIKSGIDSHYRKRSRPLSSRNLFNLVYKIVSVKQELISPALDSLIEKYGVSVKENSSPLNLVLSELCGFLLESHDTEDSLQCAFTNCKLSNSDRGRSIITTSGTGKGTVSVEEKPLCSVVRSKCGCHESIICNEYLTLAWGLAILMSLDHSILSSQSQNSIELYRCAPSVPWNPNQRSSLRYFINNFNHGQAIDDNSMSIMTWPLNIQSVFAIAATLCKLYTDKLMKLSYNSILFNLQPELIFDILCRLPTNIHSVFIVDQTFESKVRPSKDILIEQRRVGYALFNNASATNHDCSPNAIVRYNFSLIPQKQLELTEKELLSSVSIEIVPLRSIGRNQEITISYGPVHGTHSYNARQEILTTQFLFRCRCNSCCDELKRQPLVNHDQRHLLPSLNDNPNVGDLFLLCEQLQSFHPKIEIVNVEVTDLLSAHPIKERLMSYASSTLAPMHSALLEIKKRFFSMNSEAKMIDSNTYLTEDKSIITIDRDLYTEFVGLYSIVLDIEARVLSSAGNFLDAARDVQESIDLLLSSGKYTSDDIAIQRELVKLGQLYFNGGEFHRARVIVEKAVRRMKPFLLSTDPDLTEGLCMLQYLSKFDR